MAIKRVRQRKSPKVQGQVLESKSMIKNPQQRPPRRKPQPQPSQSLVIPTNHWHGNPVPLRTLPRFLKRRRIGVKIITYTISMEKMSIHSETVLIRSLWRNPRQTRLLRRSLLTKSKLIRPSQRVNQA